MPILGLMSTESISSVRWTNIRQQVFYLYPNGAAPLIGLLSLLKGDETNDPEFSWWEKRLAEAVTATQKSSNYVWWKDDGSAQVTTVYTMNHASAASYRLYVANTNRIRQNHALRMVTAGNKTLMLKVLSVGSGYVLVKVMTVDGNDNTSAAVDATENLEVKVIGSVYPQGVVSSTGEVYELPVNPKNYTQIFRTPFSFTGNAMVTPVKFDEQGVYKDKAKEHAIQHMVEIENAFLFGEATKTVPAGVADPTTGAGLPQYTTGGILSFLRNWELGAVYGNTPATSSDDDDNKRIIENTSGLISEAKLDKFYERVFRTTNNVSNEKIAFVGSGALRVINQMYRTAGTLVMDMPAQDTFGMSLVAHKTAFGTVYYKTHPLFSQNSTLRNCMLLLDVHKLRYRYMTNRDTVLLKNRQANDADYRKDEWFTECGLELHHPESFMFIKNINGYTP